MKILFFLSLKDPTCKITDTASITKIPPIITKRNSFFVSTATIPRRPPKDKPEILSDVDLEYFKIEKKYSTSIELEDEDGEFQGVTETGGSFTDEEEPVDLLSEIIQILNESFDGDFNDEDRVRIEKIKEQINENEELRRVMEGDNTDSNKRDMFDRTFQELLIGLVGENIGFYNKLSERRKNSFVKDRLYQNYSRTFDNPEQRISQ